MGHGESGEFLKAALFGAWGLVMPVFFHMLGLGAVFLPMFIPILTMGFFVSPALAALNGGLIPIISALLTGMPPLYPPMAFIMAAEGAALAGTASLTYYTLEWNLWPCIFMAILMERLILTAAAFWTAPLLGFPPSMLSLGSVAASFPGVILLIVLVPGIVRGMERLKKW